MKNPYQNFLIERDRPRPCQNRPVFILCLPGGPGNVFPLSFGFPAGENALI
jgi:hypothetical protein